MLSENSGDISCAIEYTCNFSLISVLTCSLATERQVSKGTSCPLASSSLLKWSAASAVSDSFSDSQSEDWLSIAGRLANASISLMASRFSLMGFLSVAGLVASSRLSALKAPPHKVWSLLFSASSSTMIYHLLQTNAYIPLYTQNPKMTTYDLHDLSIKEFRLNIFLNR